MDDSVGSKHGSKSQLTKFKYFAIGMKDSYRFPIFLGWRDEDDL